MSLDLDDYKSMLVINVNWSLWSQLTSLGANELKSLKYFLIKIHGKSNIEWTLSYLPGLVPAMLGEPNRPPGHWE